MAKVNHNINVCFNLGLTFESLLVLKYCPTSRRWFRPSPTHHINNGYIWKIGWSGQKDPSGASTLKADLWGHWNKNAISERIPTHCVCWAVRMTAWAQIWRLHFGFVAFLSTCILYSLQQSASFVQKFWGNAKKIFFFFFFFSFLYFFLILHIEQLQHCTQPRIITEQWRATKVVFTQENEVARMQTRTRSWQLNNSGYGVSWIKIQNSKKQWILLSLNSILQIP